MGRNRALDRWTPEEEDREFHRLVSEHYVARCLSVRGEPELVALRESVDSVIANYYRRPPDGAKAVDVGAGEGWATEHLRELGFDAIGVERSPQLAELAPTGTVLVGDAQSLPLDDGSQDFVLCNSILEHVLDPPRVIAELRRVLAPGGVAVLSTTNRWNWRTGEIEILLFPYMPGRLQDYLWRRSGRRHITPHFFTYRQLRRMAVAEGLTCETVLENKIQLAPETRKGRIARKVHPLPGASFALEAFIPIVQVALRKPAA
jgi:SAM-dependent methyltransferase